MTIPGEYEPNAKGLTIDKARREGQNRRRRTSDRSRVGGGVSALTASEVAEVRRRVRAFEPPRSVAMSLGVSTKTVLAAMRPDYVANRPEAS